MTVPPQPTNKVQAAPLATERPPEDIHAADINDRAAYIQGLQHFPALSQIEQSLLGCNSWETQYRQLILWGRQLADLPPPLKTADHLVQGCESQVWLLVSQVEGRCYFAAEADSRIIRGLITVLIAALNGQQRQQICSFSLLEFFQSLKLEQHLTASRQNGLMAMFNHIQRRLEQEETE